MKVSHGMGVALALSLASGGSAILWLGCSSDSPGGTGDGATDGGSASHDGATTVGPDGTIVGGDDGGGTPGSAECTKYCDAIEAACVGDHQQFQTRAECMNACALYPIGDAGDGQYNTLTCRMYHVGVAANSPVLHCWHAGPYGYGGCAFRCDGYCLLAMGWCGPSAGGSPYASLSACNSACGAFKDAPQSDAGAPLYNASGPSSGNTSDCREWHLTASLNSPADRDTHCPHIGPSSPTCK